MKGDSSGTTGSQVGLNGELIKLYSYNRQTFYLIGLIKNEKVFEVRLGTLSCTFFFILSDIKKQTSLEIKRGCTGKRHVADTVKPVHTCTKPVL